jgi:hypothetical protein
MTVKRNGEKVILKGGKVSCSCCEEPEECCMYPADRLGVDYQAEDLPDSLAISDVEQGDFSGEWEKSDSGYQRDGYTLSVVNGQWVIEGFTRTITVGLCLIADVAQATILDQFADTYTVDIASGALVVQVERFAVYGWISEVIQEGDNYFCIILAYCEYGGPSYGFGLTKSNNFDNQTDASAQRQSYIDKLIYVFQTGLNPKIGFNNTPEGSYPWFSTTATVS